MRNHCNSMFSVIIRQSSLFLVGLSTASNLLAAQPGDLVEWRVTSSPPVSIRFRYCPAGTIQPGKPSSETSASSVAPPVSIRDFYMGETEVTLDQFRSVLGDASLATPKTHAAKLQTTNPQLFKTLQNGTTEPVFFVSLEDSVDFCNYLQKTFDDARSQALQPSIETRSFRLPSHVEWQYAARAVASAENQAQQPHFTRWVRLAELSTANQQKCQEVWKSLGHAGTFPDNQDAFLELSRTTDAGEQEKVKQIFTEAFKKAFDSLPRSASGIGTLHRVGMTRPNAWGLTDVHEGVSEWTLWARDGDRTRELWTRIATARKEGKPLIGQDNVFLAGGSFIDSYFTVKALSRFTIWGGPKLTDEQPLPFEFQQDLVLEFAPGFRVLMERLLSEDWMLSLRHSVFKKRQISANAGEYLKSSGAIVDELTGNDHPSRIAIDFYRELVASRVGRSTGLSEILQKVARMPASPNSPGASGAKSKLTALLSKPDDSKASGAIGNDADSDEAVYFRTLANLVNAPNQ